MARARNLPALVVHGGAGNAGLAPSGRSAPRDDGAIRLGEHSSRKGSALEAVVATVTGLEDHPLFKPVRLSAQLEGNVEMDASVMFAEPFFRLHTSRQTL